MSIQRKTLLKHGKALLKVIIAGCLLNFGSIAFCQQFDSEAMEHFQSGVEYFNEGLLKAAETEFFQAVKLKPNLPSAYYNLGVINQLRGNLETALDHFKTAIRLNEDDAEFHYSIGIVYYQLGQYKKSVKHLELATLLDPTHAEGFYRLAIVYRKRGAYERAMEAYRKSISINPDIGNRIFEPEIASRDDKIAEKTIHQRMDSPGIIITKPRRFYEIEIPSRHDIYFSKRFQIGFSSGPSFPENYFFKQVSSSPDRASYAVHFGLAFQRRSNFLSDFGGDGYGFALKARYSFKKTLKNKWEEYSVSANIRIYENLDRKGRGKFFMSFGPGIYIVKTNFNSGEPVNSQYGLEGGAGFDYLFLPFISIFGEGTYAFSYHGKKYHTNSLGYIHFGLSLQI